MCEKPRPLGRRWRAKIQPEFDYFRGITKKHKMTKELVIYKYNIKDEE